MSTSTRWPLEKRFHNGRPQTATARPNRIDLIFESIGIWGINQSSTPTMTKTHDNRNKRHGNSSRLSLAVPLREMFHHRGTRRLHVAAKLTPFSA